MNPDEIPKPNYKREEDSSGFTEPSSSALHGSQDASDYLNIADFADMVLGGRFTPPTRDVTN